MTKTSGPADLEFGGPADYLIVVQGLLSEDWSERLAGMAIRSQQDGVTKPRTTLVGPLLDQAALNGVLETLYSLHLSILRVEKLENGRTSDDNRECDDGR